MKPFIGVLFVPHLLLNGWADFKDNLNEYGDNMIRLFDFNMKEAQALQNSLSEIVIKQKRTLEIDKLEFVEPQNCTLSLIISGEDFGITSKNKEHFICELTVESYKKIVSYIEPFCRKESKAYKMLYDIDSLTDFILIPSGI